MEPNDILRAQMMAIVDNQIQSNDPPETKATLDRLVKEGWPNNDAKRLIGQCVAYEMYGVMQKQDSFNEKRFKRNLEQLPKEPEG